MNKTLLIVGIILTGVSLLAISIFSISNAILKRVNKEKELEKTVEQKKKEKTVKRILKYSKKIVKKINKLLVENYVALYAVTAVTFTSGAVLTTVFTVKIIEENNSSEIESSDPSSESSEPESSSTPLNYYTVTWKSYDGTILHTDERVAEGTTPSYTGTIPSKDPTNTIQYVFDGWEPAIAPINSDVTYTMKLKETTRLYTVRWENEDNSLIREDKYEYLEMPVFEDVPSYGPDEQFEYEFNEWDREIVPVTENTTYKATYLTSTRHYNIYWLDDDLTELATEYNMEYGYIPYYYGNLPEKEASSWCTYEFDGWAPEITPLTGDIEYVAKYREIPNVYNVRWVDEDDTLLHESEVQHGHPAIYEDTWETPYKEPESETYYIFDGWDRDLSSITGDCDIKATYRVTTTQYSIYVHNPYNSSGGPIIINNAQEGAKLNLYESQIETCFADPNNTHRKVLSYFFDEGCIEDPVGSLSDTVITGDIHLYATYYIEYRVNYYVGTVIVDCEDVESGDCASGNVSGYSNYTWYYQDNPTVEFDFSTPITSDINLIGEYNNNSTNL